MRPVRLHRRPYRDIERGRGEWPEGLWSITHPSRFLLIFGTPIPGYTAPEGGPTVAAVQWIGAAFFAVGAEAWSRSELGTASIGKHATAEEKAFAATIARGFPATAVTAFISA